MRLILFVLIVPYILPAQEILVLENLRSYERYPIYLSETVLYKLKKDKQLYSGRLVGMGQDDSVYMHLHIARVVDGMLSDPVVGYIDTLGLGEFKKLKKISDKSAGRGLLEIFGKAAPLGGLGLIGVALTNGLINGQRMDPNVLWFSGGMVAGGWIVNKILPQYDKLGRRKRLRILPAPLPATGN